MSKSTRATPSQGTSKPNYLIAGREGKSASATQPPKVHREPGQGMVSVKDTDRDGK
jgi:hypothetical protein